MSGLVEVVADDDANEPNDDDNNGGDGEGSEEDGAPVVVYDGAFDVNLLDLSTLSETLTAAEIPAGDYCRIILEIENPRLVLVADPNTEITDIHLTANGRLFLKDHFEIEGDNDVIIVINFGGIHLVPNGNGGYVLTPQLRAEVDAGDQETKIEGEIDTVNQDTKIIEMFTVGGEESFEVVVDDNTVIQTDDDSDDDVRTVEEGKVLLTLADLQPGMHIEVEGTLNEGGQVLADEIEVRDSDIVAPPAVP
jgi:hypothetical protein